MKNAFCIDEDVRTQRCCASTTFSVRNRIRSSARDVRIRRERLDETAANVCRLAESTAQLFPGPEGRLTRSARI